MKVQWISKCINQGFLSQSVWALPCSCWACADSSFQIQLFSWEQVFFVIGHSCGSEKTEKKRLKTSLVTAEQQQRKQRNNTIENGFCLVLFCFVSFKSMINWKPFQQLIASVFGPCLFWALPVKIFSKTFWRSIFFFYWSRKKCF